MKKRGATNVEFVMAFILFIGFVMAVLYFFNPVRNVDVMQSSASYVLNELIARTSIEIDSYSIKINPGCGSIIALEVEEDAEKKVRVEDYYGNELASRREGERVYFERGNKDFVVIYFSEDFKDGSLTEKSAHDASCYQVASSSHGKIISERRLLQLNVSYHDSYSELKKQLSIAENIDFAFSVEFPSGQIINAERRAPARTEVFSEVKIKEILKKDDSSEFGYITAKTW